MSKAAFLAAFLVAAPFAATAQDRVDPPPPPPPAAAGAAVGGAVGAAVGGIVGGAVGTAGAIVGGITGVMRPRFYHYVEERHVPSYRWSGHERIVVGDVLPPDVVYYEVPREYGVTEYRYTVVDNEPVLVDPHTRRVVEVFD
jgi:hypothetical protein